MNFFKTSFWSAVSSVIKVLAGMVTTKIMAIFVGPNGVALLGNFNNIMSTLTSFSNGAIGSGITKYISEYDSEEEKRSIVAHSVKICLICSSFIGAFILVFNKSFAKLAFGNTEYNSAFIIGGLTIVFFGLNTTISAVYNGYRYIKYLIITGIIGSILSVILAFVITMNYGLFGALINTAIAQVCIFVINIYFIRKLKLVNSNLLRTSLNKALMWKLFKYAIMSTVTAVVVPMSTLMIRKYVLSNFSANEAGYIQGIWNISGAYLMVVTTTLSIYYLPTLSSIKDDVSLRSEIFKGYKFLLPMTILGGIIIYVCRDLIITVLYTPEFLPMRRYFAFQIIGDMFKIASWILAFLMIAKAMTKWFIITEILFTLLYVALSFFFMKLYGSIGVTYAYVINYFLYLIFMVVLFRNLLFGVKLREGE